MTLKRRPPPEITLIIKILMSVKTLQGPFQIINIHKILQLKTSKKIFLYDSKFKKDKRFQSFLTTVNMLLYKAINKNPSIAPY